MRRIFAGGRPSSRSRTTPSVLTRQRHSERSLATRSVIGNRLVLHGLVALTAVAGVAASSLTAAVGARAATVQPLIGVSADKALVKEGSLTASTEEGASLRLPSNETAGPVAAHTARSIGRSRHLNHHISR